MSPHAITPPPSDSRSSDTWISSKFAITQNGFLPSHLPLAFLPDSYYEPWEQLIQHLPAFLKSKSLRSKIDRLPVLSVSRLSTTEEWRRAYVILGFLAHAYIWGGDKAAEVREDVHQSEMKTNKRFCSGSPTCNLGPFTCSVVSS
jgi:indoleamine 2,3-dioxygenase